MAWSEDGWRKERARREAWVREFLAMLAEDQEAGRMVPDPDAIRAAIRNVLRVQ